MGTAQSWAQGTGRSWRLPALLVVLAMVVGACSSAATSPGSSSGASGAPAAAQFCKGMKIVFFPGGTPGGGFETVVYNGAKAAAGGSSGPTSPTSGRTGSPRQDDHPVPAGDGDQA